MNDEDIQEGAPTDETSAIDVETLNQILSNYFYTKDEQTQMQSETSNQQLDNQDQLLVELQSINHNLETLQYNTQLNNNVVYLGLVVALAVFFLVMFYKFSATLPELQSNTASFS